MRTVAIASRKGGAGKTTVAVHLAAAAEQAGLGTAIVDLDPQASAATWSDLRAAARPEVRCCPPNRLSIVLAEIAPCDLAVIDTAPHAEGGALAAARAADLVVIPCRPALFDFHSISATVDIAGLAGTPAAVLLNAVPPRGPMADEARDALAAMGIDVLETRLVQRQAFVHSLTAGLAACEFEPRSKAAAEIRALHREIALRLQSHRNQETSCRNA
ncbi:MAG: ParA family protein [Defluviicoccus sp.]|nr:ParA family protein [Defluviicoccus sp.]MDE0274491.1 ParA family protein [Defluviicoccus sp.]